MFIFASQKEYLRPRYFESVNSSGYVFPYKLRTQLAMLSRLTEGSYEVEPSLKLSGQTLVQLQLCHLHISIVFHHTFDLLNWKLTTPLQRTL